MLIPISTNSDSGKTTIKKLLLLDADVVIDLHNLSLFEKMSEQNPATRSVFAGFFR
jgi:hypothetical protein